MTQSFRFLDDVAVADIAFEAEGDSVEELFRAATRALLETMADPLTVGTSWEQAVEQAEDDPASLLFAWLETIVYWKDAAGVVFHEATLTVTRTDRWVLQGRLVGARVDHRSQELRNDVKGITKHLYEVTQEGARWRARVVLDV
jgi:SHS2 domain-containing protein